jgi:hypothetical protein
MKKNDKPILLPIVVSIAGMRLVAIAWSEWQEGRTGAAIVNAMFGLVTLALGAWALFRRSDRP